MSDAGQWVLKGFFEPGNVNVVYAFSPKQVKEVTQLYNGVKKSNPGITLDQVYYWYAVKHNVKKTDKNGKPLTTGSYALNFDANEEQKKAIQARSSWMQNNKKAKLAKRAKNSVAGAVNRREEVKAHTRWNLPAHKWSTLPSEKPSNPNRLGKLYFYEFNSEDQYTMKRDLDAKGKEKGKLVVQKFTADASRNYGFQFMWNPETYSTTTSLQPDVTPSKQDVWVSAAGMFPGAEAISFTVRLDRTNDFACFRQNYPNGVSNIGDGLKETLIQDWYPGVTDTRQQDAYIDTALGRKKSKLDWLMRFGTLADLEYLYRSFTDINTVNKDLGDNFVTADVGYIGFFILCLEIGPIYYIGYITGLSVDHLMFTEDYVPIRTDVTIQMNVIANGSDTSGSSIPNPGTGDDPRPVPGKPGTKVFQVPGGENGGGNISVKYISTYYGQKWGGVDD